MANVRKEVALYELAKKLDPEPIFAPNRDRSYPDKDCEWFQENDGNGENMRLRVRQLLGSKQGYAVQTYADGDSILSHAQLPAQNYELNDPIPDFINEYSGGWIRIEDEFWEWVGDNVCCYLCRMNARVPIESDMQQGT